MTISMNKWLESGKYLPSILRDFHDQKDVFKTIHILVRNHESTNKVNWIDAHIYVIDVFLWFMAKRGWTLQRSRMGIPFSDLENDIERVKEVDRAVFSDFLSQQNNTSQK
jgi:hypothetical protein